MRVLAAVLVTLLCLEGASACSRTPPPAGRWEGSYDSDSLMVLARLEIDARGEIFLTAPDAMNVAAEDRPAVRRRLADGLAAAWAAVQPRTFDFDGRVFRKPGGIAPQLEWNPDMKQMTAVIYPGLRPSVRIHLRPVSDFSEDPWSD